MRVSIFTLGDVMNEEDLKKTIDKMDDPDNHWDKWLVVGGLVVAFSLEWMGVPVSEFMDWIGQFDPR